MVGNGILLNPSGCWWKSRQCNLSTTLFPSSGENLGGPGLASCQVLNGCRVRMKYFAVPNAVKKSKKRRRSRKFETLPPDDVESDFLPLAVNNDYDEEESGKSSSPDKSKVEKSNMLAPSRGAVLQACTLTSCFIGALGILIRQVSHSAYTEGFPIFDCSQISFRFELWHIELIAGLVVGVSSCRYILLNSWTEFAESSEAANCQVLSSLEPLDYLVVAFLPGISEEMLFQGALLHLFGINWMSIVAVAAIFGVLQVVENILSPSGLPLLGLLMVGRRLHPQASSYQWCRMPSTISSAATYGGGALQQRNQHIDSSFKKKR